MVRAIRQQQPDAVFHLGDCERDTQRLEKEFPDLPLYRVCGNCDREPVNPEVLQLTLDGVKFFLTHGHRYSVKYALDALLNAAYFAGADMVLVKVGANDLIHPHCRSKQGLLTPVTFAQMTAGYRALADMAHAQGVRIWFCELTPWKGYTRNLFGRGDDIQWSPEYDALRLELNAWFQSADCPADGYIPLDALADPDDPDALIPAYTTDGVHHTPAGQRALAALIPEDIFG